MVGTIPHLISYMLSFLAVWVLLKPVEAMPAPPHILRQDSPGNSTPIDLGDQRSLWSIVWTCLLTIFTCTWVAIHPNLPALEDSWWDTVCRRIKLMAVGIIAPELIIFWAMSQWIGSRDFAKAYEHAGWTVTHGFFIQMGGFVLARNDKESHVLVPEEFEELYRSGKIALPNVTEKEIEDRSKGDILSKGLVILQTSWFIVQCIARGAQGLAITEIELATLAFAVLNGVMYFLWWNKPLDVGCPVAVVLVSEAGEPAAADLGHSLKLDVGQLSSSGDYNSRSISMQDGRSFTINDEKGDVDRYFDWMARVLLPVYLWTNFLRPAERLTGSKSVRDEATEKPQRVSTFYASPLSLSSRRETYRWILTAGIAAVFGGVHCIAWSFHFGTQEEQILWRISGLVVVCVPLYCLFYRLIIAIYPRFISPLRILFIVALNLYIFARLFLLAESIVALRSLPPGAYKTIQWTTFIPHL